MSGFWLVNCYANHMIAQLFYRYPLKNYISCLTFNHFKRRKHNVIMKVYDLS